MSTCVQEPVDTTNTQIRELVTQAREGNRLHGFSFCTLERIGGTPCVLVGMASVRRTSKRDTVLRAMMGDQLRRAVLAFPDEDVLVGTRLLSASGFQAFKSLDDIVPRPKHKATGEERAWSRRLAKRFGAEGRIDDRTFVLQGDGNRPPGVDFESLKPDAINAEVRAFFDPVDVDRGDAARWPVADQLGPNHLAVATGLHAPSLGQGGHRALVDVEGGQPLEDLTADLE